jgi:hypothetical protein
MRRSCVPAPIGMLDDSIGVWQAGYERTTLTHDLLEKPAEPS